MNRHLDIDFKELGRGQHIFQAPQSCNKTGSLKSLEGERVLLICARNSLLAQIKSRLPKTIQTLHYETTIDKQKRYKSKQELGKGETQGLGINYSSLYKLSNTRDSHRDFDYLVIDEPILLWSHSTQYKPDWRNESEYLARIIHTPVVIYLGADFPEHLLEEIDELGKLRGDDPVEDEDDFYIIEENDSYDPDLETLNEQLGWREGW